MTLIIRFTNFNINSKIPKKKYKKLQKIGCSVISENWVTFNYKNTLLKNKVINFYRQSNILNQNYVIYKNNNIQKFTNAITIKFYVYFVHKIIAMKY